MAQFIIQFKTVSINQVETKITAKDAETALVEFYKGKLGKTKQISSEILMQGEVDIVTPTNPKKVAK